jgi:hypothetical protein
VVAMAVAANKARVVSEPILDGKAKEISPKYV